LILIFFIHFKNTEIQLNLASLFNILGENGYMLHLELAELEGTLKDSRDFALPGLIEEAVAGFSSGTAEKSFFSCREWKRRKPRYVNLGDICRGFCRGKRGITTSVDTRVSFNSFDVRFVTLKGIVEIVPRRLNKGLIVKKVLHDLSMRTDLEGDGADFILFWRRHFGRKDVHFSVHVYF